MIGPKLKIQYQISRGTIIVKPNQNCGFPNVLLTTYQTPIESPRLEDWPPSAIEVISLSVLGNGVASVQPSQPRLIYRFNDQQLRGQCSFQA